MITVRAAPNGRGPNAAADSEAVLRIALSPVASRPASASRLHASEATQRSSLWANQARPAASRFFVLSSVST